MSQHLKVLLIAMALMSIAVRADNQQTPRNSSADETAIRQVVQRLQDGWNARDGKAFAAPFATDADYVVVNGMALHGRDAIEKGHTAIFATIYKESHNVGTVKKIRFLRPDVATVLVEWKLEFRSDGEMRTNRAMNTMVMVKEGGAWSIAAFHNTPIQAEGAR